MNVCIFVCYSIQLNCCGKDCVNPPTAASVTQGWFLNLTSRWSILSCTLSLLPAVSAIGHDTEVGLAEARLNNRRSLANLSISSGCPSSCLLFIVMLALAQRESGPAHLLLVTLLIAPPFPFLRSTVFQRSEGRQLLKADVVNKRWMAGCLKSHRRAVFPLRSKMIVANLFCYLYVFCVWTSGMGQICVFCMFSLTAVVTCIYVPCGYSRFAMLKHVRKVWTLNENHTLLFCPYLLCFLWVYLCET